MTKREPMSEKKKHGHWLTIAICAAIVLAVMFALLAPHAAMKCEVGGEVFLNLLKMLVVPLVMSSVMSGILGLGDVRKLGKPGAAAVAYYVCTTILAVVVGLVVVNLIRPGVGTVDEATLAEMEAESSATKDKIYDHLSEQAGVPKEEVAEFFGDEKKVEPTIALILKNLILSLFTDNLFKASLEMNLLPLIVFSIIFAGMLTTLPNVDVLKSGIEQINTALMSFVLLLMKVAPIGIFCLVTSRFGEAQAEGEFVDGPAADGLVRPDHPRRPGDSCVCHTAGHPVLLHSTEPLSVLRADVTGSPDGVQHGKFIRHAAGNDGVRGEEGGGRQTVHGIRLAARSNHQYGWNGTLRGGGGDLHRPGHRRGNDPDAPAHHRADGHTSGHRGGRYPGGRIGDDGDCAQRRGPSC